MKNLVFIWALFCAVQLTGQGVVGTWKTIDDDSGEAKSYIQLSIDANGVLSGTVTKLLQKSEETVCDKCSGDLYNKKVVGMAVLRGLKLKDGYYQGGTILDPTNGKTYKCKLWVKDGDANMLEVRGMLGPFYRTQFWVRVP
jgi:uncharacterized protein (DUF2147 family)